ncbi:MAG: hypothetical protein NTX38_16060 [Methylobacter sp.]|nr:hypothetical protein [Methylobacter sp.]
MNKNIKKIMTHYILASVLLFAEMSSLANANQYYVSNVSPIGSDTACNGTANTPVTSAPNCAFLTITKAANTAVAGDKVAIANGTYNENVNLTNSGTASSRITFTGTTSAVITSTTPIVSTTNPTTGSASVTTPIITGKLSFSGNYITMQGITISTSGMVGDPENNSVDMLGSYNVLNNSTIVDFLKSGVVARTVTNLPQCNTTAGVKIYSAGNRVLDKISVACFQITALVFGNNSSFNTFSNSSILNMDDIDVIHVFGHDQKIVNNLVNNVNQVNYDYNHTDFIQTWGSSPGTVAYNVLVDGNTISNGSLQGGNTETNGNTALHDWTFSNNIFANVENGFFSGLPNTHFYNNLWYQSGAVAIYQTSGYSSEGVILINNAFIKNTATQGAYDAGWIIAYTTPSVRTISNNYYGTTTGAALPNGTNQVYESTAIKGGNPAFVNAGAFNFNLQSSSVFIGHGINAPFTNDAAGNTRDATWDIGPYMYGASIPVTILPPANMTVK